MNWLVDLFCFMCRFICLARSKVCSKYHKIVLLIHPTKAIDKDKGKKSKKGSGKKGKKGKKKKGKNLKDITPDRYMGGV